MVRDSVCYLNDSLTHIQAVCQFFLRGACKFGDKCHNEHPQNGERRSAFGGKSSVALHCLGSLISLQVQHGRLPAGKGLFRTGTR
jgi:hypothetical protein